MHPDVAEVMQELDAHRARFIAFCRALTDEELERQVPQSEWLVRDFIAHLATIDRPVAAMFSTIQEGRQQGGGGEADRDRWDVDRFNQGKVEERRQRTIAEILTEAAAERVRLRKVLGALQEETLSRTLHFGGDARRSAAEIELRSYLRGWCKHDPMHAVDMLRALPERRTPLIEQWIDDPVIASYQAQMNR